MSTSISPLIPEVSPGRKRKDAIMRGVLHGGHGASP